MADAAGANTAQGDGVPPKTRSDSFTSQKSTESQTAADFIRTQMQLEADAREAMPYVSHQSVYLSLVPRAYTDPTAPCRA